MKRNIKFEFEGKLMEAINIAYVSEKVVALNSYINNDFFEEFFEEEGLNYCIGDDTIKVIEKDNKLVLTYYAEEDGDFFCIRRRNLVEILEALKDIIYKWYLEEVR